MKSRKQKVICRVLCMVVSIFLLASFFVVPVAALDELTQVTISNIMYIPEIAPDGIDDPDYRPFSNLTFFSYQFNRFAQLDGVTSGLGDYYPYSIGTTRYSMIYDTNLENDPDYIFGVYYINQLFDDSVERSFAKGDTVFLEPGEIPIWVYGDFSITKCRFTIRNHGNDYDFSYSSVVASTDVISCSLVEDGDPFIFDQLPFTFYSDIKSSDLCLCFELLLSDTTEDTQLEIYSFDVSFNFGSGVSPNYPIYPPAPGGDDIGNLDSQEQQLIQDSQAGLDAGVDVMQNTGSLITDLEANLNLVAFTGAFNQIMNRIVLIPGLNPLVSISLSLGLFASLFGLAGSIISAASRGSGQAHREAQRESRKK